MGGGAADPTTSFPVDTRPEGFQWIESNDAEAGVYAWVRKGNAEDKPVVRQTAPLRVRPSKPTFQETPTLENADDRAEARGHPTGRGHRDDVAVAHRRQRRDGPPHRGRDRAECLRLGVALQMMQHAGRQQQRAQGPPCTGANGALEHVVGVAGIVLHVFAEVAEQRAGEKVGALGKARHALMVDEGGWRVAPRQRLEGVRAKAVLAPGERIGVNGALGGAHGQLPSQAMRVAPVLLRGWRQRCIARQFAGGADGREAIAAPQIRALQIGVRQTGGDETARKSTWGVTYTKLNGGAAVFSAGDVMEAIANNRAVVIKENLGSSEQPNWVNNDPATEAIRAMDGPRGKLPILVLTADVMPATRERAMAVGVTACLLKPLQTPQLAEDAVTCTPGTPALAVSTRS